MRAVLLRACLIADFGPVGAALGESSVRVRLYFQIVMAETLFENGNGGGPTPAQPVLLRELSDGDEVCGAFVVRERERRQKRNGEHYLRIVLADRTGTVPAVAWEAVAECFEVCAPGSVVLVSGASRSIPSSARRSSSPRCAPPAPASTPPSSWPSGRRGPIDLLEADLRELITTVQSPPARAARSLLRAAPSLGALPAPPRPSYHQAYAGVLEHTRRSPTTARRQLLPGIDREIAVTGAMLHDIGKTEAYNDDPLAIELTDAGRLEVRSRAATTRCGARSSGSNSIRTSPRRSCTSSLPPRQLEHGSPVVPATREATLVHAIDNLGGKLGSFDRLEREARRWGELVTLRPRHRRLGLLPLARRLAGQTRTRKLRIWISDP